MVCGTTTCRMARNPSRVAVKRREVGGLQGEAFSALDLSEIGCVESHPTRISGRSSVDPAPRRCHCRHFQGQNRHFQGRRRRNFHTRQIRKSLGGFSKISRHANRNKITVRSQLNTSPNNTPGGGGKENTQSNLRVSQAGGSSPSASQPAKVLKCPQYR